MPQPQFEDHPAHVRRFIDAALAAADPAGALLRAWKDLPPADRPAQPCVLVAAGKASVPMARAVIEGQLVKPAVGVVVVPAGSPPPPSLAAAGLRVMEADHPLPSQRNLIAAQAVLDAGRIASSRGIPLIVLLSGGASAHLTFPERGLTLSDVRVLTDALLRSGATIREINTVRKHIERLKGGNLARAASPSPVFAFILADVLGEPPPLDVIASGPTAPDPTTYADALEVLERRAVVAPAPILERLRAGAKGKHPETLKDPDEIRAKIHNSVIGSNGLAVSAAADAARSLGFHIAEARLNVDGEAAEVGEQFAQRLLELRAAASGPIALIWGGETTVTARGPGSGGSGGAGSGGRNQEVALAAAVRLADQQNVVVAAFGTDGIDGVAPPGEKPAAGAIVTGRTAARARGAVIDLRAALTGHDTFPALKRLGAHIHTGPTGTNVNDLMAALAY